MTDTNPKKLLRLPAPVLLLGVRSLGVKLADEGGQLAYTGKPKILTAELLDLLKARKADLLAALQVGPGQGVQPLVGQTVEDYIRDNYAASDGAPPHWRDLPTTDRQRETLRKGNVFDIPATRGEASDRIKDLIESGALCDFLSLAELESFDHRAPGSRGRRRRFCCPLCGTNKDMDATHRCLSVDTITGGYRCFRCDTKGKLREYLGDAGAVRAFVHAPQPKKEDDAWYARWAFARSVRGTPGVAYLASRGVPLDTAVAAGVRFGNWYKAGETRPERFSAVIFPIRDVGGKLVAAQARAIDGDDKRTRGDKSQGVFFTTPGRSQRIAITEAPIDALVLAACGLPAIALCGTSWPTWLADVLGGRDVAQAQDADEAGDKCAGELEALLAGRATIWRLRPQGAKDWAELAERDGLGAVRRQIDAAESELAEHAWGNAA